MRPTNAIRVFVVAFVSIISISAAADERSAGGVAMTPAGPPLRVAAGINNGVVTSDFPSTGLYFTGFGTCSATLIGCRTALTAAHCVCNGLPCDPTPSGLVYFQHSGSYQVVDVVVDPGWISNSLGRRDLALLRLGAPVAGVQPTPLNDLGRPPVGLSTLLVGFGTTSIGPEGVKRAGLAELSDCLLPSALSLCYDFEAPIGPAGEDSTACPGDSGGPMFVSANDRLLLAGATSGGAGLGAADCSAPVQGVFSDVFSARSWIQSQTAGDLGQSSCGGFPNAGEPSAPWSFASGVLGPGNAEDTFTLQVPPDTRRLSVTLNAEEYLFNDFDLYLRRGAPPTPQIYDCRGFDVGTLETCVLEDPAAGTWFLQARNFSGAGLFQMTATTFLPATGGCVRDAETACLQGGRFEVKVDWSNASDSGTGQVMSFGGQRTENEESAFFSFQSATNFEMGVKMLNACIPLFGDQYWVFTSGLTDQGWQVTVRDTQTGAVKTYGNADGNLSTTFADTSAFDC